MRASHLLILFACLATSLIGQSLPVAANGFTKDYHQRINGAMLHFRVSGSDKTNPYLLLLPDGPGGSVAPYLSFGATLEDVVNVVYLDPRGGGESERYKTGDPLHLGSSATAPVTMANMIADIDSVRLFLRVDRWVVLGHGFGAMLGLEYAAAHPGAMLGYIDMDGILSYTDTRQAMLAEAPDHLASEKHWLTVKEYQKTQSLVAGLNDPSNSAWMRDLEALKPDFAVLGDDLFSGFTAGDANFDPGVLTALITNDRLSQRNDIELIGALKCPVQICSSSMDGVVPPSMVAEADKQVGAANRIHVPTEIGSSYYPFATDPEIATPAIRAAVLEAIHMSAPALYLSKHYDTMTNPGHSRVTANIQDTIDPRIVIPNSLKGVKVTVYFTVAADGAVSNVHLDHSTGNNGLDAAIISAVLNVKYTPATKDGKPIAEQVTREFDM